MDSGLAISSQVKEILIRKVDGAYVLELGVTH